MDHEIIVPKIEVGACYEIMNFHTNKTIAQCRVVLHDTRIMLTSKTVFKKLTTIQINQRIDRKCDLVIQNIRNEEAKITLWSDVAHSLSALSLEQLPKPIIVVFTSLRVKLYLLFSIFFEIYWPHSIRTLPPSSKKANEQEILQIGKKVTIEELGYLDPDLYENDMFFCKASIKQYNTMYEWWYTACPTCAKQMYKDPTSGQLICQKHPNQIPTPR
ncbi:hypothetical protein D8674_039225 [Pyrus ussuriensis x Pyrus communis]|uniref:Replication factor A C-terminal domain-containing protein n=1 Tax=Pyrus ussuriensis x Pyrus communis TaxID=2448454 RepID=A0A5N5FNV2_9ROSA|nr:hypothetical protein D8674_039220 [Pyrus ussuriensis x Pyrus communis]KAB2604547.1 hypothetical protein D8674_039225 [Pyrus ussuriensis x Pyrus communis]